jgi:hypothetical protein
MATSLRPKIFRVTGLPATNNVAEVESRLRQVIFDNLNEDEKQRPKTEIQCVPSCDSATFTALVNFKGGHPAFLSELGSGSLSSWQVEMSDDDDISFDLHFLGFTQLYPTADDKPITAE